MGKYSLIPVERIENAILLIRGQKVLLDRDLASLYGVTTGNLNRAVQRNLDRFPGDFMFQLTEEEAKNLRFHFGISSSGHAGGVTSLTPSLSKGWQCSPASCARLVR